MSCQICVEVCPFEAIKMDTQFELATDDRFGGLLFDCKELSKSNEYYHQIHPTEAAEVDARLAEEKAKADVKGKAAADAAAKAAVAAAAKPAVAAAPESTAPKPAAAEAKPAAAAPAESSAPKPAGEGS